MKKRHEEIARSEFANLIAKSFTDSRVSWHEPPRGQDHPDWYLDFNGTRYAVEATTIVPNIGDGRGVILEPSITASIGDFIAGVEARAIKEGSLIGAYAVSLAPMPNNRKIQDRVASRILGHLRATKDLPTTELCTVDSIGGQPVEMQKFHMGGNYLAELIHLGTRSEVEIRDNLCKQLRAQVERKSARYEGCADPVVLLLLDGFHIADPKDWLDAAATISSIGRFDAVFRIKPANRPLLLFSQSPEWKPLGRL
jgi:hypothetical protein